MVSKGMNDPDFPKFEAKRHPLFLFVTERVSAGMGRLGQDRRSSHLMSFLKGCEISRISFFPFLCFVSSFFFSFLFFHIVFVSHLFLLEPLLQTIFYLVLRPERPMYKHVRTGIES